MKTDKQDTRPQSYWALAVILAGVSGKARREMIRDFWNAGAIDQLDASLLKDELNPDERQRLGRIHPLFMGGEYLPKHLPGEVAIVRIELESTTHDVIELRAQPLSDDRISLRWVDEYETEFNTGDTPTEIEQPFSQSELIDFIQSTYFDE